MSIDSADVRGNPDVLASTHISMQLTLRRRVKILVAALKRSKALKVCCGAPERTSQSRYGWLPYSYRQPSVFDVVQITLPITPISQFETMKRCCRVHRGVHLRIPGKSIRVPA